MKKRIGFAGIIVHEREKVAEAVNEILSEYGEMIIARTGVPYRDKNCCVITIVVDMTTDDLGALTGKLGGIPGVSVKAALSKNE